VTVKPGSRTEPARLRRGIGGPDHAASDPAGTAEPITPGSAAGSPPPPRRVAIFAVVSIALMMASIDQTIVATALPALQHGLHASINWAGWTITVYSLAQVLILPLAGKLSDQYGRRRVFLAAVVLFTLASLCCGLANDIYVLVALRAVQAVGGAAFTPSATGIVVDYSGDARDRAVGLFGSIFPIGTIIGPILGGLFVSYWSWRGIFLVNVPVGLLLIVLCFKYIPRDDPGRVSVKARLDVVGMVLLGVGVLGAMLGVSYLGGATGGVCSLPFIAPEIAAAVAVGLFLRHTYRVIDPFIPPRLLRGDGFGTMNLINFLYGGAASGLGALVPLYAVDRYGIAILDSGTLLSARGIGTIAVSVLATLALRRTGYRWPMLVGFVITAAGMFALAMSPIDMSPYLWLATAAGVTGIGMGLSGPATRNASLQLAPEQSAVIASLRTTGRQAGSITAISVTTAILAQASNPGLAFAHVFTVFAVILLVVTPLVALVPEHHGRW
jgi:EmrB/QacA subfamily drug resistance transporter